MDNVDGNVNQAALNADSILSLLRANKLVMLRNHPDEVLASISEEWARSLGTISWEDYSHRKVYFFFQPTSRVNVLNLFWIDEVDDEGIAAEMTGP